MNAINIRIEYCPDQNDRLENSDQALFECQYAPISTSKDITNLEIHRLDRHSRSPTRSRRPPLK